MNYSLKNEFYTLTVSSTGAEAISIKNKDGRELLWQNPWNEGWQRHAPLLFPFCGRLKDAEFICKGKAYPMTIHGFAPSSEFTLVSQTETSVTLVLESNDKTRAMFPFDFKFTASYRISGDEISLFVTVENTGDEVLPFMFGWHPGFVLFTDKGQDIEDYEVRFKDKTELIRALPSSDYAIPSELVKYPIPTGAYRLCEEEIYECDTMVFRNSGTELTLSAEGHPYKLEMSYSDNLPVLCIWKMPMNEAKYICLEPWSHSVYRGERSNDLAVKDMTRLPCGEKESYFYKIKFSF